MQFLVSPGNLLLVAKPGEDYRGFCFSGSCRSTSEPVPCHLTAWPAAYFHERRSLNNFHRDRVITFEQIAE
ncbi:hypothetical protein E8D96_22965 [Escherichia coli]